MTGPTLRLLAVVSTASLTFTSGCATPPVESEVPTPHLLRSAVPVVVFHEATGGLVGSTEQGPVALPAEGRWTGEVAVSGLASSPELARTLAQAGMRRVRLVTTGTGHLDEPAPREALSRLTAIPSLERVELVGRWTFGPGDLCPLGELPGLRSLRLSVAGLLPGALADIASLPRLTELDLSGTRRAAPAVWSDLPRLVRVESLGLRGTHPQLHLDEPGALVSEEALTQIGRMTWLRELDLGWSGRAVTDAGLAHLRSIRGLRRLGLDACWGFTAGGLAQLGQLGELRVLELGGEDRHTTEVDDAMVASIARAFPRLERLRIGHCSGYERAAWEALGSLVRLEELELADVGITDEAVELLARARRLRRLSAPQVDLTRVGAIRLCAFARLECLVLTTEWSDDGAWLDDELLERLASLPLVELRLDGFCAQSVSADGIEALCRCRTLERVGVHGPGIDDRAVAALTGLPRLRELVVRGRFGEAAIRAISRVRGLERAEVGSPLLTGVDLASLARALPAEETCHCSR